MCVPDKAFAAANCFRTPAVRRNSYEIQVEADDLALHSHLTAASCFWRAGQVGRAQTVFDER